VSLADVWEHLGRAKEHQTAAMIAAADDGAPVEDQEMIRRLVHASMSIDRELGWAAHLLEQSRAV
jgi:hypothetical protein